MGTHDLWSTPLLTVRTIRSEDGRTVEVVAGTDPVAAIDDGGTVTAPDGTVLARVPLLSSKPETERRATHPSELFLRVEDASGTPLGRVRVRKHTFSPLGKRIMADVQVGGETVAEMTPVDRKGENIVIAAGPDTFARLRQVDHDRGLRRSVTTWELTVDGLDDPTTRVVGLSGLLRYAKIRGRIEDAIRRKR